MNKTSSPYKIIGIIIGIIILIPIVLVGLFIYALGKNTPQEITDSEKSIVSSAALRYVNQKYGYHNFSVSNVEPDDNYDGFTYSGRSGYYVTILADDIDYCNVTMRGENPSTTQPITDSCTDMYYEKDEKKVFNSEYELRVSFDVDGSMIPENYGRYPTFNELLKLKAANHITISQNRTKKTEEKGLQAEYIKDITEQFIAYYNITEPFEYNFSYYNSDQDYYYGYSVSVDDAKIDITSTRDNSMMTISR